MSYSQRNENALWPQYIAVFTALLAIFCSGIHMGWPSPTIPRILSEEYPFNVTTEEASYITIIGPLGDVVGIILSSLLVDIIGRKKTILLIGVPQIVSMLMIYFSTHSVLLLYFARLFGGISEGACFTVLPLYICEVAEPKIRGFLGSSFSLVLLFGLLFVNIVGSYLDMYTSALIYLACSLFFLLSFSIMPESPYFLLMKQRPKAAEISLKKLRGGNVDSELYSISADVIRQMSEKGRYKDLYKIRSNKMAMVTMIILRNLQQFSGVSSFTLYAQLLFKEATDAIPQHLAAILMLCFQGVATLVGVFLMDRIGRRLMLLLSIGGCFFTLTANAVFFSLRDFTSLDLTSWSLLPLIVLIIFIVFFSLGLGCAVNLLGGELFPANVKAKASCLSNIVFAIGMMVSTKFYQFMADTYSLVIPFGSFGLIQLVGFVLCWKTLVETKNKTLEEIQQELKGNKDKQNAN